MDVNRVIGERDLEDTPFSADDARTLFRDIVRARRFDERAIALQRRGWMSGYPPFKGQEASQVGAAHALHEDDWLVPTYRSNAMQIAFGVPMSDILVFRRGHAEYRSDHDLNILPQAVPIASQIPHGTGLGMAANYTGDDAATLCYFGDGATSEGDFHEGANFAGVFEAPVVFFCENNNWAISLPRHKQTASETISEKAAAYGIHGIQVDGNDPLAVREVVQAALSDARQGNPILVESLTYRQGAHTTSDDPDRYREVEDDLPDWRTADPVERYEEYLREQGIIDDAFVEECFDDADDELEDAVEAAESIDAVGPDELFDPVYEELSPNLEKQKQWLREYVEENPDVNDVDH